MKLRNLLGLLFAVVVFSYVASAQAPSLKNVGDDVYTSKADGFEIAVPEGCMQMSTSQSGRDYVCELKEGRIAVMIAQSEPAIKTDADRKNYFIGFKGALQKNAGIQIVNEMPARIGDYSGTSYVFSLDGDTTLMIALAWEKFTVTIIGRANSKVADSAELIGAAVQSFAFISDK